MLGRVELTGDVAMVAPAAFTLIAGAEMSFDVEEMEMLVDLYLKATFLTSAVSRADFTVFVDGLDAAAGANGMACLTPALAGDINTVSAQRTVRLAKGTHILQGRLKVAAGNVTVKGTTIPCELVARRHSHPATLGHGVDSKAQLIQ